MRRVLVPLLVSVLTSSLVIAQVVPDASFRSEEGHGEARWGMTAQEVWALYPAAQETKAGMLFLGGQTVAGKAGSQVFLFSDDRLTSAGVVFTEKYVNKTNHVRDYRELQGLLRQKYGAPKDEKTIWKDPLYRDRPDQWGLAVSAGHLVLMTLWETPQTQINLVLRGERFEIHLGIRYASTALAPLEKARTTTEKLKGL